MIEELRQALFPDETEKETTGHKVTVSDDAAINLQGALHDLKSLHSKKLPPDEPCINTIERVTEQLSEARAALSCEQCSAVPPAAHHPDCVHYCDPAWRSPAGFSTCPQCGHAAACINCGALFSAIPSTIQPERKFTGPGYLEQSGHGADTETDVPQDLHSGDKS